MLYSPPRKVATVLFCYHQLRKSPYLKNLLKRSW
jgi:hypothetical protein